MIISGPRNDDSGVSSETMVKGSLESLSSDESSLTLLPHSSKSDLDTEGEDETESIENYLMAKIDRFNPKFEPFQGFAERVIKLENKKEGVKCTKSYIDNIAYAIKKAHEHPLPPRKKRKPLSTDFNEEICPIYGYKSNQRNHMSRHMSSHSEERPYVCSLCQRGFKIKTVLINHVYSHVGYKPWACPDCGQRFTSKGLLIRHVRYIHTKEKRFKCNECGSRFVESSKLKQHIRVHTGERPYQCPQCSYASKTVPCLQRHILSHSGVKRFHCDICGKKFTVKNSMMVHRLKHTGQTPALPCGMCPKSFTRDFYRKIHIHNMHSNNNDIHMCEICNETFRDRYTLKNHKRSHRGEKCFKCSFCHLTFASNTARQNHHNVHTDQRPFLCTQCNQSFRQKQSLRRHQTIYHSSAKAEEPNEFLNQSTDRYWTKDKQKIVFKCSICNKEYLRYGNLESHMRIHSIGIEGATNHSFQNCKRVKGRPKGSKNKNPSHNVKYRKISNRRRNANISYPSKPKKNLVNQNTLPVDVKSGMYKEDSSAEIGKNETNNYENQHQVAQAQESISIVIDKVLPISNIKSQVQIAGQDYTYTIEQKCLDDAKDKIYTNVVPAERIKCEKISQIVVKETVQTPSNCVHVLKNEVTNNIVTKKDKVGHFTSDLTTVRVGAEENCYPCLEDTIETWIGNEIVKVDEIIKSNPMFWIKEEVENNFGFESEED